MGKVFLVRHHQVDPAPEHGAAFFRSPRAPSGKRSNSRVNRLTRLCRPHSRNPPNNLACCGIVNVDFLAAERPNPRSVDVASLPKQQRISQRDFCRNAGHNVPPKGWELSTATLTERGLGRSAARKST